MNVKNTLQVYKITHSNKIPLHYTVICPKVTNTLFDLLTFIFSLNLINILNYLCLYVKYTIGNLTADLCLEVTQKNLRILLKDISHLKILAG